MRSRFMIAVVLCGAALFSSAIPAVADERPVGSGGAYVSPEGDPTAVASDRVANDGSGGSSAEINPCEWNVIISDDVQFAVHDEHYNRVYSSTGRWLVYWCYGVGAVPINGDILVPEGGVVDPQQVAVDALASVTIPPPTLQTSPSANGRLYVQVPTWLWLEPSWWRPYEATANAGRVSSTVRATPIATTWTMGDGHTVTCFGPGTEWRPGLPESTSTCTHIYRTSSDGSPGGSFVVDATVTFEVSWTSNLSPGGTLPVITRTQRLEVQVGEIQAIGTRGSR
jgi:hypothetical protein